MICYKPTFFQKLISMNPRTHEAHEPKAAWNYFTNIFQCLKRGLNYIFTPWIIVSCPKNHVGTDEPKKVWCTGLFLRGRKKRLFFWAQRNFWQKEHKLTQQSLNWSWSLLLLRITSHWRPFRKFCGVRIGFSFFFSENADGFLKKKKFQE